MNAISPSHPLNMSQEVIIKRDAKKFSKTVAHLTTCESCVPLRWSIVANTFHATAVQSRAIKQELETMRGLWHSPKLLTKELSDIGRGGPCGCGGMIRIPVPFFCIRPPQTSDETVTGGSKPAWNVRDTLATGSARFWLLQGGVPCRI